MPSPFPGMDPWLEHPFWQTIHVQLIAEAARLIFARVRPRYVVLTEQRVLADDNEDAYPDALASEKRPQWSIEVRDAEDRQLATVVEVLCPQNKRSSGFELYMRRRNSFLTSSTNLVEIDLHRAGERVIPRSALPRDPYFVFLSRPKNRSNLCVWPVPLSSRLPVVNIPLLRGEADAVLDLQQAFMTVYDAVDASKLVDYSGPPSPPLNTEDDQWASQVLRSAGLRT